MRANGRIACPEIEAPSDAVWKPAHRSRSRGIRPYRDPRDYILSWTDAIWIDRGLGRLTEHYDKHVKVHTAYGETYDWDFVVNNSLQKFSAFPNGGGGHGEDVIWEGARAERRSSRSHRVFKSGTHTGYWTYGAPTGKHWIVAHRRPLPRDRQPGQRGMARCGTNGPCSSTWG